MPTLSTLAVNIEQIVSDAGIQVARNYHAQNPVSGFAYREGTHRIIGVNTATSPRRQRFSIAHAYAHLLLHCQHQPLISCYQIRTGPRTAGSSEPTPEMEDEANRHAAELLMPEDVLRAELARQVGVPHSSRDQLIERMAAAFEVSCEAMGWRLMSLSLITG